MEKSVHRKLLQASEIAATERQTQTILAATNARKVAEKCNEVERVNTVLQKCEAPARRQLRNAPDSTTQQRTLSTATPSYVVGYMTTNSDYLNWETRSELFAFSVFTTVGYAGKVDRWTLVWLMCALSGTAHLFQRQTGAK